jgi:hypothetical protein
MLTDWSPDQVHQARNCATHSRNTDVVIVAKRIGEPVPAPASRSKSAGFFAPGCTDYLSNRLATHADRNAVGRMTHRTNPGLRGYQINSVHLLTQAARSSLRAQPTSPVYCLIV